MRYLTGLLLALVLCLPLLAQAAGQKVLLNAATADATGSNIATEDRGAVGVSATISGTATLTFKASADGGVTFSSITCTNVDTLVSSQSTSATGQFQCPVAGMSHFETPLSGCSGCTVTSVATSSNGSFSASGASVISGVVQTGTNTAAAPSRSEGTAGSFSFDLVGNARVTMGTLLSGEDQTNNLLMTSGGAVRITQLVGIGGVPSTGSDATGTATILPVGKKTFLGIVTCTGTCVQTQKIYAAFESSATVGKSFLVCTLTLSNTTTASDYCVTDIPASYWFVVTSLTSGTTPLAGLFAMY